MEESTFQIVATVFCISRMEPLLVYLAMLRNSKFFSSCSPSSLDIWLHFNADILLFFDLIFYIFSLNWI